MVRVGVMFPAPRQRSRPRSLAPAETPKSLKPGQAKRGRRSVRNRPFFSHRPYHRDGWCGGVSGLRRPLYEPPPENSGIVGVDSERQSRNYFEVEQFYPATVLVAVKAANPALVQYASLQHSRNVTDDFGHKAPEQSGDFVLGHPYSPGGGTDDDPFPVYRNR